MISIKEYAMALVRAICTERQELGRAPAVASLNDVTRKVNAEVQTALEELVATGRLRRTENINRNPMYNPIDIKP